MSGSGGFTLSGTAADATAGLNTHNSGTCAPWAVRVNVCEVKSSSTLCSDGSARWYNSSDSSFTAVTEPAPPLCASDLTGADWQFNVTNRAQKFKDGYYYRTKVIAQDKVANIEDQASKSMVEFLVDNTIPVSDWNRLSNLDEDTLELSGGASDPEPTPDPGAGVNASGIPDKSYLELSVRRDEGTESPVPGTEDYWWNGST